MLTANGRKVLESIDIFLVSSATGAKTKTIYFDYPMTHCNRNHDFNHLRSKRFKLCTQLVELEIPFKILSDSLNKSVDQSEPKLQTLKTQSILSGDQFNLAAFSTDKLAGTKIFLLPLHHMIQMKLELINTKTMRSFLTTQEKLLGLYSAIDTRIEILDIFWKNAQDSFKLKTTSIYNPFYAMESTVITLSKFDSKIYNQNSAMVNLSSKIKSVDFRKSNKHIELAFTSQLLFIMIFMIKKISIDY